MLTYFKCLVVTEGQIWNIPKTTGYLVLIIDI